MREVCPTHRVDANQKIIRKRELERRVVEKERYLERRVK